MCIYIYAMYVWYTYVYIYMVYIYMVYICGVYLYIYIYTDNDTYDTRSCSILHALFFVMCDAFETQDFLCNKKVAEVFDGIHRKWY